MVRRQLLIGLALASPAASVRHTGSADIAGIDASGTKFIHGVPVYNYHLAFQPDRTTSFLEAVKGETDRQLEHWNVFLKDGITDSQIVKLCQDRKKCPSSGHTEGVPFISYTGTQKDLDSLLDVARNEVDFVEPDLPTRVIPELPQNESVLSGVVKMKRGTPWGLERIQASERKSTGKGVHIYVLDTGVRTTHGDFQNRAVPTLEVGGKGTVKECKGDTKCAVDRDGHGTHCAGTAAGKRHGVAPGATVHAVKVLGDDGSGASSWTLLALDWVVTKGQRPAVVSMSLGSKGTSTSEQKSVDRVVKAGITVVVAAGNENDDACKYQPAFVPSAITVGAIDERDRRADYSNYGKCVDIFAPGSDVESCGHTADFEKKTMSGTSMACPHVAGAAALLLERHPTWTPEKVEARLLKDAEKGSVKDVKGAPNSLLHVGVSGKEDQDDEAGGEEEEEDQDDEEEEEDDEGEEDDEDEDEEEEEEEDSRGDERCPRGTSESRPDEDGNCRCHRGTRCLRKGSDGKYKYCPHNRRSGGTSDRHFVATCRDCKCYS